MRGAGTAAPDTQEVLCQVQGAAATVKEQRRGYSTESQSQAASGLAQLVLAARGPKQEGYLISVSKTFLVSKLK